MTLQNSIVCQKTDCISYGQKVYCYSTLRLQDEHCKLYLKESEIKRINQRAKTRRLEAQL